MADRPLPAIVGCTASGKTAMALALAERWPIEVISADSRQIYRGMDIGTAKPDATERNALPHHLIDVADPDEYYSAGRFAREALERADSIGSSGSRPLVVGGTGLYMIALAGGLDDLPVRNDRIRRGLRAAEEGSPGFMRRALLRLDPERAEQIDGADLVRHVRALEIVLQSGRTLSELRGRSEGPGTELRAAGLRVAPAELKRRIAARTAKMLQAGLVDEVRGLMDAGYGRDSALGRTIGYAEIIDHLEGMIDLNEAVARIETNTWRLARRQRNIFRRLPGIRWFGPGRTDAVEEYLFGGGKGA
ncbi:MAG: tRNA (adenosine(37)-N6)-dimethylallyltransferase MiaA [Candidatus Fermentibacteraceae bacterium]